MGVKKGILVLTFVAVMGVTASTGRAQSIIRASSLPSLPGIFCENAFYASDIDGGNGPKPQPTPMPTIYDFPQIQEVPREEPKKEETPPPPPPSIIWWPSITPPNRNLPN